MTIYEVYNKYKHITLLEDRDILIDPLNVCLYECWQAIKEKVAEDCPTEEEYKRTNQLTLHLPIKTEWLDMIAVGIKLEEYREIKPYWTKRLCKKVGDRLFLTDYYKEYTHVKFHNYGKSLPVYADLIKIHIGEGKEEWGAVKGECYHVITIDNPVQDLPF